MASSGDGWIAFAYSPTGALDAYKAGDSLADAIVKSVDSTDAVLETDEGPVRFTVPPLPSSPDVKRPGSAMHPGSVRATAQRAVKARFSNRMRYDGPCGPRLARRSALDWHTALLHVRTNELQLTNARPPGTVLACPLQRAADASPLKMASRDEVSRGKT